VFQDELFLGEPLLFRFLHRILSGDLPPGFVLVLHPLAFAGWVGLFVTGMNLIPMGQLDGGHITRSLFGAANARRISWFVVGVLLVLGVFYFTGWILWAVIGALLIRRKTPPPMNDDAPPSPRKRLLGIVALAIFILTFIPAPVYAPLPDVVKSLLH